MWMVRKPAGSFQSERVGKNKFDKGKTSAALLAEAG